VNLSIWQRTGAWQELEPTALARSSGHAASPKDTLEGLSLPPASPGLVAAFTLGPPGNQLSAQEALGKASDSSKAPLDGGKNQPVELTTTGGFPSNETIGGPSSHEPITYSVAHGRGVFQADSIENTRSPPKQLIRGLRPKVSKRHPFVCAGELVSG